jgi:hypothetical protein
MILLTNLNLIGGEAQYPKVEDNNMAEPLSKDFSLTVICAFSITNN